MPIDWSGYTAITIARTTQLVSGCYYWFKLAYKTSDKAAIARNLNDFLTKWNTTYSDRFEILEIKGPPNNMSGNIEIYGKARCEKGGESPKSLGLERYWATPNWDVFRYDEWQSRQGIEGVSYYEMDLLVLEEMGVPGNEPTTPVPPGPGAPAPAEPGAPAPAAPAATGKGMPAWGWIGIALGVAVVLFLLLKRK